MPFVEKPVCAICRKVHPRDTNDTLQMFNHKLGTVNVCNNHIGVKEEYHRQTNLPLDLHVQLARETVAHAQFQQDMKDLIRRMDIDEIECLRVPRELWGV